MAGLSRNKGKAGERELARLLAELTGHDVRRRVRQHDGDDDLVGVNDLLIIRPEHLDVEPGHSARREKEGQNQAQACCGPGFALRTRGRATEQHHQQSDLR